MNKFFSIMFPKRTILSFYLLIVLTLSSKGQTQVYDAFIHNHKVGEMKVVREVNDESEKIYVTTHIEAHMLVKIRVDFESRSSYMNGVLMEGEAISKTNGKVHSKASTLRVDNGYQIQVDKKEYKLESQGLIAADIFYFEEPVSVKKVYALSSGEILDVESMENGKYHFVHDGKKELHSYKNGMLDELHIEHKLYKVIFRLQTQ